MATLMAIELDRKSLGFCVFVDTNAMLRHHIPIVESMCHQHRGPHGRHVVDVVSTCPKIVVVACNAILVVCHFLVAHLAIAVFPFGFVTAVDKVVEDVDVFSHVSTRMPNKSV